MLKFLFLIVFIIGQYSNGQAQVNSEIYVKINPQAYKLISPNNQAEISLTPFLTLFENSAQLGIEELKQSFKRLNNQEFQRIFKLKINGQKDLDNIIKILNQNPYVEYAEKVPEFEFCALPNDIGTPSYFGQYYLYNIEADKAWDISKGNDSVIIAVIDAEFDYLHEDLKNKIWINKDEIPNNQIDDDNDGYVDNINGWDVGNNDNDVKSPHSNFYHGTAVSGIIAAETNNNLGIASVGYQLKVLPIKTTNDSFPFSNAVFNVDEAISYAIEMKSDIINCSFISINYSKTLEDLFNFASDQGIIIVAAAGNNNLSNKFYPAAFNGVISVAATDNNDQKTFFSNYGDWVKISAPGITIKTTLPNNNYDTISGSSLSTAMVSATIGLMKSKDPEINNEGIISCLLNSSDSIKNLDNLYLNKMGAGRLNVFKSLQCLDSLSKLNAIAFIEKNQENICPSYSIQFFGSSKYYDADSFAWTFENGIPSSSNLVNPIITYSNAGSYDVQLIVKNKKGIDTLIIDDFAQVNSRGTEILFQENFEDSGFKNSPKFSLSDTSNTFIVIDSILSKKGKYALYFNGSNFQANQKEFIDLSLISIKGRKNSSLSFDYAYSAELNSKDSFWVLIDKNNQNIWDTLYADFPPLSYSNSSSFAPEKIEDWNFDDYPFKVDLKNYENIDSIKIRLVFSAVNASSLFLDNFVLDANCAQINDKKPISIFNYKQATKCSPSLVEFMDSSLFFPDSFFWIFPGGTPSFSQEQNPKVIYNEGGQYEVTLITKNAFGYDTLIKSELIVVEEKIDLKINPSSLSICQEDTIEVNFTGASNYNWFPKLSSKSLSPNNDIIKFYPRNSFEYQIRATNEKGCSMDSLILISVNPKPVNPTIGRRNDSLFSSVDSTNLNYFWYLNQNLLPLKTGPAIKIEETGTYELILENSFACTSISNPFWVQELNKNKKDDFELFIYPNPASDYFEVQGVNEITEIELMDLNGKSIKIDHWTENKVEIKNLAKGIYFVRVHSKNEIYHAKLIIIH